MTENSKPLELPAFYKQLLDKTPLIGPVETTLNNFSNLVHGDTVHSLPFFPEYTGHGLTHYRHVLEASENLIIDEIKNSKEAKFPFTAEDAAVISCATLLHDSAMHLTPEGFRTLVQSEDSKVRFPDFDEKLWPELWNDYQREGSRWDQRTIRNVLGDGMLDDLKNPVSLQNLRKPLDEWGEPDSWSRYHNKFIGEFIRRHHGRLAHEFAHTGMPGVDPKEPLPLLSKPNGNEDNPFCELHDLCGLVARSHTMGLRDTFQYLQDKYHGKVECRSSHPVYLMVLLRIADYLHVESERAPSSALKVKNLASPFSRGEWDMHGAIKDVLQHENDTEAQFVIAEPETAENYLRVRNLLDGIQDELDKSWAVLGEVFSKQSHCCDAGIQLRRVRSNLDDLAKFEQTVDFIPERFQFTTAGASLLSKLAAPLYGNRIEVGIRELLQNSLDAVNELEKLSGHKSDDNDEPKIIISVDKNPDGGPGGVVTVEDFGIGMDRSVLSNYFLKAGATFRDSEFFKENFEKDGKTQVTRSGRFGIGVLAAYLLGDRIEVTTRHYNATEDEALTFSASIHDDLIEVNKCKREKPGSTLQVRISDKIYKKLCEDQGLEWDWYFWNSPRVVRSIDGNSELPKKESVPMPSEDESLGWLRTKSEIYDDLVWTYQKREKLICNGILVGRRNARNRFQERMWSYVTEDEFTVPFNFPNISVWDQNGNLPLDLSRSYLTGTKCIDNQLLTDVTLDYAAFCYVFAPTKVMWPDYLRDDLCYPGLGSSDNGYSSIFHADGTSPTIRYNTSKLKLPKIFFRVFTN